MKVNDPNSARIAPGALEQTQRLDEAAGKRASEARGRQSEDKVQLSDLADSIQELSADSPQRAELVEKLAAEYREGRYEADPVETSRALVADALQQDNPQRDKE